MIQDQCFTNDWIAAQRVRMPNATAVTIEKSIRAFVLLERLAASDLRFVFKGGTCMMLHLRDLRRLSVDIDIVCTEGLARITPVLDVIGQVRPFTRWDEDKRNPDRRPKRKHFRFFYDSLDPNNPEPFVLLDVVLEHVPHPFTERKPVAVSFVETVAPPKVTVPTLNGVGAINATLVREAYTVEEARISASRAGLLATLLRYGRSGRLTPYRFVSKQMRELPPSLGGRYAVLNPLREIATEAFHNWHQVQILEL